MDVTVLSAGASAPNTSLLSTFSPLPPAWACASVSVKLSACAVGTSSTTFTVMVLSTSVPSISVTVTVRSWEISSMPEPLCSVVLPLSS